MENKYKISIPEPCHEDWNKMKPEENGRFCNSCTKNVVDFTGMSSLEIQNYFIANQDKKTCGRFKNEQLDSIVIQISQKVLFSQVHFHKMFLLALLISMGTSLFSCQNSNGDKQKIDGVEVVDSEEKHVTVGVVLPSKEIRNSLNTAHENTKKSNDSVLIKKPKIACPVVTGEVAIVPQTQVPKIINE